MKTWFNQPAWKECRRKTRSIKAAKVAPRLVKLDAVSKISNIIHSLGKTEGLVPIFINANSGKFRKSSTITFGARGDSYYEYLLKQWIQTGKRVDMYKDDFLDAMKGVK